MLSLAGYNFYIYTSAADMRMGINGLSGIVRNQMALDPLAKGIIYMFFNGGLTQVKMLQFDGDGQALYYKRLAIILEGIEIKYRKRYERKPGKSPDQSKR